MTSTMALVDTFTPMAITTSVNGKTAKDKAMANWLTKTVGSTKVNGNTVNS